MVDYSDTPLPSLFRALWKDYVARLWMHVCWVGILATNFSVETIERI